MAGSTELFGIEPQDARRELEAVHENGRLPPLPRAGGWRFATGVFLFGAAALAYATQVEPTWLEVKRRELALPRLPPALEGLRIAHMSDFHLSRLVSPDYLVACVAAAMAQQPDLVLLTGDFVTHKSRYVFDVTQVLQPLAAP